MDRPRDSGGGLRAGLASPRKQIEFCPTPSAEAASAEAFVDRPAWQLFWSRVGDQYAIEI